MSSTDITGKSLILHCYKNFFREVFVAKMVLFESPWLHSYLAQNQGVKEVASHLLTDF